MASSDESDSGEISNSLKRKRGVCKYTKDWEATFAWITNNETDRTNTTAYCKLCQKSFTIEYNGIKAVTQHASTKNHLDKEKIASSNKRINSFFIVKDSSFSEKVTVAEMAETYHGIKHHISFLAQDCGIKLMKQIFDDSEIVKKMSCGRTKSSAIVNEVLYPFSIELVLNDLKTGIPFSLSTDASNKGNRKMYPVVAQYFTCEEGLCVKILDFYEDSFEDSTSIKNQLCRVLSDNELEINNVSAYSADNASVNYGVNKSVYQKLLLENDNIVAAHCNNHILHNSAKNALKQLSFDIENVVLKVFAEFSNSAKKREELKSFFEFCESEFHEVLRHVPTRWLSLFKAVERLLLNWIPLKSYFISLGSDECHKVIWNLISDQENELAKDDEPTISELYLYFTHFFMSIMQDTLLKLESKKILACDLHIIMCKLRDSLQKKYDEQFFGMKVLFALRKKHLPENAVQKFKKEAINVYQRAIAYLEKWYNFTDSVYETLSCFNLIDRNNPPTLEEMTNIWLLSPWREELPPNTLFDEISALEEVYVHLQGDSSLDKWTYFFKKEPAPSLLKLFQYCASIPVSNANVERIFSVMGNLWTDERNRLLVPSVRSELCIFFNISQRCTEIKELFLKHKELIKAAQSNKKYTRQQSKM